VLQRGALLEETNFTKISSEDDAKLTYRCLVLFVKLVEKRVVLAPSFSTAATHQRFHHRLLSI